MVALAIFNGLCELDRPERFGVSKLSWAITLTFQYRTTSSLQFFKPSIVITFCVIYVDFEMQLFSFKIKKSFYVYSIQINGMKVAAFDSSRYFSLYFLLLSSTRSLGRMVKRTHSYGSWPNKRDTRKCSRFLHF